MIQCHSSKERKNNNTAPLWKLLLNPSVHQGLKNVFLKGYTQGQLDNLQEQGIFMTMRFHKKGHQNKPLRAAYPLIAHTMDLLVCYVKVHPQLGPMASSARETELQHLFLQKMTTASDQSGWESENQQKYVMDFINSSTIIIAWKS